MKSRNLITPLFPIALFSFLVFCSGKRQGGEPELLEGVIEQLNLHHYQPVKLNDELSAKIFDNFLDKLDNERRFFTQQDMKKLEKYRSQLDDQIKRGSYEFMDTAWNMMTRRMNQAEVIYLDLLQKPFNFSQQESWNYDSEHPKYAKDDKEFQENWRKSLKFNTLERVYRKTEQQKEALNRKDTSIKVLSADTLEARARAEVLKANNDWFKRLRRMNRKDKLSFYINSITEIYDPHTNFFPPADKQNFDIGMSGKLEGIGATLVERDGYIKVERIVPGSASYRQGDLKAGDLIIKVGQAAAEPVDVVGMDIDDAIQLIRGKKGTEVRLTVKKPDGSIKVIPIVRDVVIIEEGFAKSATAVYEGKTFGIINLPSFYADFNERGGRSSAEDVRRDAILRAARRVLVLGLAPDHATRRRHLDRHERRRIQAHQRVDLAGIGSGGGRGHSKSVRNPTNRLASPVDTAHHVDGDAPRLHPLADRLAAVALGRGGRDLRRARQPCERLLHHAVLLRAGSGRRRPLRMLRGAGPFDPRRARPRRTRVERHPRPRPRARLRTHDRLRHFAACRLRASRQPDRAACTSRLGPPRAAAGVPPASLAPSTGMLRLDRARTPGATRRSARAATPRTPM